MTGWERAVVARPSRCARVALGGRPVSRPDDLGGHEDAGAAADGSWPGAPGVGVEDVSGDAVLPDEPPGLQLLPVQDGSHVAPADGAVGQVLSSGCHGAIVISASASARRACLCSPSWLLDPERDEGAGCQADPSNVAPTGSDPVGLLPV